MSDVTIPFSAELAQYIVLEIAREADGYNKAWAWWAHDARTDNGYRHGEVLVHLVQSVYPEDAWSGEYHGDPSIELVFKFTLAEDDPRFFRIVGEYSSYSSDNWSQTLREVRPTKVTRQVFETV